MWRSGGAVLVSAGDDYASPLSLYRTPLGEVLPAVPSGRVIEEPFKPTLTELGEKHPVTRDLPGAAGDEPTWGRWFRVVDVDPRDAEVLMKGAQDKPLLVLGERGEGRVGCCFPTMFGCGRAAMRAADRTPTSCAGSPIG